MPELKDSELYARQRKTTRAILVAALTQAESHLVDLNRLTGNNRYPADKELATELRGVVLIVEDLTYAIGCLDRADQIAAANAKD